MRDLHCKPFITSRTEQNSALFVEYVSQLLRIQNHFSKTRTLTLNILLVLLWLWKLKVNQSTAHHFCALFIYFIHSQNRLLNIFLCLCIFLCIYLLTVFHWMRLCLLYLVYFYFYMKVGLWIFFSYLICFMLSFVDSHFCNKKERFLILHFLFVSSYIQSWTLETGILTLSNINLHFA